MWRTKTFSLGRIRSLLEIVVRHEMRPSFVAVALGSAMILAAHPLGNFSVNRFMKFEADVAGVEMKYAIDLAEIPTFELFQDWEMTASSPRDQLDRRAAQQSRAWMRNLAIRVDGRTVEPVFESAELVIADGAGNLPVVRITARMRIAVAPGRFVYEDHNFDGRAGWKEIVIDANHARIISASQDHQDRSNGLTAYPPDPLSAPPQDLRAEFTWVAVAPVVTSKAPVVQEPIVHAIAQPHSKPAPPPAVSTPKSASAGAVVRNDFLSRLLRRDRIPFNMILAALIVAFGLGAAHALTPGHGKTLVAAYLVGSRGTMKHAALLGAMVTVTHTISVFGLGFATLVLFGFVVPEKIAEMLGVVSGLSVFAVGAWTLVQRLRNRTRHTHHHHDHDHAHSHDHNHDSHHHHHGPAGHTHMPDGKISMGTLIALAVSGGLVPCESALVLLLSAITLGRVGLGLLLLTAFSLGLAGVLMIIGMAVLYAKRAFPTRAAHSHGRWLAWVPVGSAAFVTLIGIILTGVSLSWLPSRWLIG
jgi:nickel/cobalt transporter (NicO) family protein